MGSSYAFLVHMCWASSSRQEITSSNGPSPLWCGTSSSSWPKHEAMSASTSSASVSWMKTSTSREICGVKCTPLGCHVLPSAASPMCCSASVAEAAWGLILLDCRSPCCCVSFVACLALKEATVQGSQCSLGFFAENKVESCPSDNA